MEVQELLEQEKEANLKRYRYEVEGKVILASYWQRKLNKIASMRKLAAALTKRQLKANGITKLNTIKI